MLYGVNKAQEQVRQAQEEVEMSTRSHDGDLEPSSAAPLIEHETDDDHDDDKAISQGANAFLYLLTLSACIGGLLFGYDTGVVSATLVSIRTDLSSRPLSTLDKSFITSSTSFFALLASPLAGLLADRHGRKNIIALADVLFILGALWQALTSTVAGMIAGRSLVGLAIGGASMIVPLYIAELAPGHLRGRLTTLQLLLITGGQAIAYIIGYLFSAVPSGWRWMVGLGAVPAVAQILLLALMPETPRYLAKTGQEGKARQVLSRVYNASNSPHAVEAILAAIKVEIAQEEEDAHIKPASSTGGTSSVSKATLLSLFTHPPHLRALTVACLLQGLQQLCGFNVLMYFSSTIFQMLGFHDPVLASLSVALTNFTFTIVAFFTIDRLGRRRSLLYTIPIMTVSLCTCALSFHYIHLPDDSTSQHSNPSHNSSTIVILLSLILYVASYATGLGPVPWHQSELFPLPVRSLGSSLSTATNWTSNTLVGLTFLPMLRVVTPSWTFAVYALVCVLGWFAVWRVYPETSGLELEEVGRIFESGFGVEESMERFEKRRLKRVDHEHR